MEPTTQLDELATLVQQLASVDGRSSAWEEAIEKLVAFTDAVITGSERWPGLIQHQDLDAVIAKVQSVLSEIEDGDTTRCLPRISATWLALERIAAKLG